MPYTDPGEATAKLADAIGDLARAIEAYAMVERRKLDLQIDMRNQARAAAGEDSPFFRPPPRRLDYTDFTPPSTRPR